MNKADKARKANRDKVRRYRARKAAEREETARQVQAKALAEEQAKAVSEVQARAIAAKAAPAWADPPLPELPPIRRPDPLYFDPASDPFRPAFWQEIDPNPQPIRLPHRPITALLHQPVGGQGVTYSVADGHRDRAAEAAAERLKQERSGR